MSGSGLSQSELQEINDSFHSFDLNRDGSITPDEIKQCLRRANVTALDAVIDRVIKTGKYLMDNHMDSNRDGRISYDEYLKFMTTVYRGTHQELKRQDSVYDNFP
ncbi:unnamed protein product [Didymodactylos carnosus]|uniref:EF-hand domain-containing protein n=1 Tax=Didymodactylos carnosus TaxID=1234261 RepID=A0A813WR44_9BILA|nr:unnamed protein product [Didymodactylos carnosus]CAF3646265.1 unnamed protein product [Didymodactylos carnosus]